MPGPENLKIGLIGGGSMGEAILAAIIEHKLSQPADIRVSDIAESRRFYLVQKYGVVATANNTEAVMNRDVIILAVKPQNMAALVVELSGKLHRDQLVISIAAGIRLENLGAGLNHRCIIRVMPNTPAQIGEGMSVWTAKPEVTARQRLWAASILASMGKEIYLEDEKYLDMATAVSGSGPAYVFLFMESLMNAAESIGLPAENARELVIQTVLGSSRYANASGRPLADLRRMVTSPGGTTAEALRQLEEGKFSELIRLAVVAAYEKAKKLGG